jgi:hypothetical protein
MTDIDRFLRTLSLALKFSSRDLPALTCNPDRGMVT